MPDEGIGLVEGGRGGRSRGQALEGIGDTLKQGQLMGISHGDRTLAA
jgi:hypothetical protein